MKIQSRLLPVYVMICALLWGTAFPGIKYVYSAWPESQQWDGRMLFAGIRFMIAGLMIMPFARRQGIIAQLKKADLRLLAALAMTQTFAQYVFFYMGLSLSSGVLGSLMVSTGSFWWILLAPMILKTPKPDTRHWVVLLICALGISVAVYKPGIGSGSPLLGVLCFLAASFNGAVGVIILKVLHRTLDSTTATAFSLFLGGVVFTIAGSSALPHLDGVLKPQVAGMILYLAFVSAAAFVLWNRLAREFSVNILAGYRFLIPLAGIILSTLLIPNEKPGLGIYIGAVLILGSLVYVNYLDRKSVPSSMGARP